MTKWAQKTQIIISMLKIEQEYETPDEANSYQKETISSIPQKADNNQETTNYTTNIFDSNSNMKKIYHKNNISPPKKWTIPLLLEWPQNRNFQPLDLETYFLIDSGAESNIVNIPIWVEFQNLYPKLSPQTVQVN